MTPRLASLAAAARALAARWPAGRRRPAVSSSAEAGTGRPLDAPAMDARFRRICAIYADGRCLIARSYESDHALRRLLLALRQAGAVPWALAEESADLDDIARAWGTGGDADGGEASLEALRDRLGGILREAAEAQASDLVFERGQGRCSLYAIVNERKLPLGQPMTPEEGRDLMGFMFHAKDEGSAQTGYRERGFQGFSISPGGAVPLPDTITALRCQRGPHEPEGDHLFIRLFAAGMLRPDTTLGDLGFDAATEALFAQLRARRKGGIFLGGTTGDGKTTTLAVNLSLQMAEAGGALNLVTVEDPVEYRIPGAVQIAVPTAGTAEARSAHYRDALMHFCRIHPASGMVSEIRDAEAARQVLQFIDTGHQVWTTIHCDSANAIPFRLLDLGVTVAELCKPGNTALLMRQTLITELCPECALPGPADGRPPPPGLGADTGARYRNPEGCPACRRADPGTLQGRAWNGYTGPRALSEHIRPDAGYLAHVRDGDPQAAWAYWTDTLGGVPLGARLAAHVAAGKADPFDALTRGALLSDARPHLSVIDGDRP